ncbi:GGDEF domain-containing protein [uncultured Pseudoalteromonas sp.]|uniref:GGDEF domain-containing protein n=1 Tax=uncultured Pseudoalteromonas sp. TaxID=114053 RepID=UPI00259726C2|nr:GGDEF domain-containing protein [uncultured Pseudoalteromonas sp.]
MFLPYQKMYILKLVLFSLSLFSSFAFASEIDWQSKAADHIRLNIILFINLSLFILILFFSIRHIKKLKRLNITITNESLIDPLTKVLNRKGFHEQVSRLDKQSGFLLIADIDNFKLINDRFGHNAGDKVLQRVAHALKVQTREKDIVGRYGGEEFVVFFPSNDVETVKKISHRLVLAIASLNLNDISPELTGVTISAGVDKGDTKRSKFERLYENADQLLYKAKAAGKNQVIVFDN